jgi:hypothetical protein
MWYSTTGAGYNKTWRVGRVLKRIGKDCHDAVLNAAVEPGLGRIVTLHYRSCTSHQID